MTYREAMEARRSIRSLSQGANVGREEVVTLIEQALTWVPSGYNMQAVRLLLLTGKEHQRFWHESFETLMEGKDEAARAKTRKKFDGFAGGMGTVLFFDDMNTLAEVQGKMPKYAATMEEWMHHGQGMMQYGIWTGLVDLGLAVSIQHYNPIVDTLVAVNWKVPESWTLRAQMPYGGPKESPAPRQGLSAKARYMAYGD